MTGSPLYLTLVMFYQTIRWGYFLLFGRWALWMKYSMFLDEEKERGGGVFLPIILYHMSFK
jgi:hypothetical protein